jgi:hypothetical protein
MTPNERQEFLFDLRMALRKVPPGVLRDMGKRRLPGDELSQQIAAEAILEHLRLCRWEITRPPAPGARPGHGRNRGRGRQ